MKTRQIVLAISPDGPCQQIITELQRVDTGAPVHLHDPREWAGLINRLTTEQPEVLLLELAAVSRQLDSTLRQIRSVTPDTRVIIIHPELDSQSILNAMRAGADEFIHPPWEESLRPALERLASAIDFENRRIQKGKIIAFLSAKGGCGATTIACHVASDLWRQTSSRVMLADFDLVSGMVGFLMKTGGLYSLIDAVQNLGRLDESLWKALIAEVKPKLSILPSPASFSFDQVPNREQLRDVLRFMRTQHEWILLDLGRSLSSVAYDIYNEVDQIFLVSVLEVIALNGLKSIVRRLRERGDDLTKLQIILNRAPKMMDITSGELEKILGRPLYATVPNDYPSLNESYSSGTLLPSNNKLYAHFASLTSKICGLEPVKQKKRFSLLG